MLRLRKQVKMPHLHPVFSTSGMVTSLSLGCGLERKWSPASSHPTSLQWFAHKRPSNEALPRLPYPAPSGLQMEVPAAGFCPLGILRHLFLRSLCLLLFLNLPCSPEASPSWNNLPQAFLQNEGHPTVPSPDHQLAIGAEEGGKLPMTNSHHALLGQLTRWLRLRVPVFP